MSSEFLNSLQLAGTPPELVFERLVGNLAQAFNGALAQERIQRVTLQSAPDLPTMAVRHSERSKNPHTSVPPEHKTFVAIPSQMEIYLQFWFPTSSIGPEGNGILFSARASTTARPVTYALASSSAAPWEFMQRHHDSRMDSSITPPTLPGILTKVIDFNPAFPSLPRVAVWLTGLFARTGAAVSIEATATYITTTHFTLHIDSSAGDRLLSVSAAWAVWNGDEKLPLVHGIVLSQVLPLYPTPRGQCSLLR